jgi:hypothetical protein
MPNSPLPQTPPQSHTLHIMRSESHRFASRRPISTAGSQCTSHPKNLGPVRRSYLAGRTCATGRHINAFTTTQQSTTMRTQSTQKARPIHSTNPFKQHRNEVQTILICRQLYSNTSTTLKKRTLYHFTYPTSSATTKNSAPNAKVHPIPAILNTSQDCLANKKSIAQNAQVIPPHSSQSRKFKITLISQLMTSIVPK